VGQYLLEFLSLDPAGLETAELILVRVRNVEYRNAGMEVTGQDLCLPGGIQRAFREIHG
jgi:hypothetical protein